MRNVRLLVLLTSLVGCAGRVDSDRGREEPFQPDEESLPPIVSGSGGATAPVPTASGGVPNVPPDDDPGTLCDLTPGVVVRTTEGAVILDTPSDDWTPPRPIELATVQCSGARDSKLLAFQNSSGSQEGMGGIGGAPTPPSQGASLLLNFASRSDGQAWVVEGDGEYISPLGERFVLVLDEDLSPDLFEIQPQMEATIRYLGTNAEGQTESFEIALRVCSRLDVCTI